MFYKVVWQYMQEVVGFLITIYCNFTQVSSGEKNCKKVKIGQNYAHEFVASYYWPTL